MQDTEKKEVTKNDGTVQTDQKQYEKRKWDAILDPGWTEKYAKLPSGIRMCYCEMGPEDGDAVLLVHGAGDCRISWSRVAPVLAEGGKRVIVAELRGHGKTDLPRPKRGYYLIDDYTEDLAALLDAIGVKAVHYAGHSCGSLAGQLLAARYPEKVRTLTLIATGPTVELFQDVRIPEDAEPFDDAYCRDWAACTILDPAFKEATYQYVRQLSMDAWRWIQNGIRAFDSSGELGRITCPVQIIWGSEDAVFSAKDQEKMQQLLIHAPVTFIPMAGSSHSPHWDSWESMFAVAQELLAFAEK